MTAKQIAAYHATRKQWSESLDFLWNKTDLNMPREYYRERMTEIRSAYRALRLAREYA